MSRIRSLIAMAAMADSLNQCFIDDNKPIPYRKRPLNNKQAKARKKSKSAKQNRRKNR